MANWTALVAAMHASIKNNTTGAITGDVLQVELDRMIIALGATSGYKGIAVPATDPPAIDGTAFYLASENGVYSNFGITITRTGLYVFEYQDGAWTSYTVLVNEEVAIQPWLNGTKNVTLVSNVLTFGVAGFTLLVGNKNYVITGDVPYTFSRVAATRGFLYFDLDKVKGLTNGSAINWTSNNPFVVTTENLGTGDYYLIASYYTTGMLINDTQLAYSITNDAIVAGINFPNQNKIYQQFGKLFCYVLPQVYITVDTTANLITIPIGFSVMGLSSKSTQYYTTVAEQTCSIMPVNLAGATQASTLGVLLFDTTALTFKTLLHSETQPANTLVVGMVRRTEYSTTKVGDVYIWGLEVYKLDGVIKGSANNIIDRNRDIEALMLGAVAPKNSTQRYTFAHISDIHEANESITNLANYVNLYPINAVYQCGDLNDQSAASAIPSTTLAALDRLTKPFYPVVGNHDKGGGFTIATNYSNLQVYNEYIAPFLVQDGVTRITPAGANLSYYKVDNTTYHIRTIFLNEFDNDLAADGTDYAVSRGYRCFGQAQIDWLCARLLDTPSGYSVIIVLHQAPFYLDSANLIRSSFSYQGTVTYEPVQTNPNWMLPSIVNAYLNKINLTSTPLSYGFVHGSAGFKAASETALNTSYTVTINTNFSSPTNATPKFIGYFCGHSHVDIVGFITDPTASIPVLSPKQPLVMVTTANYSVSHSLSDDLPRVYGTKSQDAFNICSVDTTNERLYVVRVGSNTGSDLSVRKSAILNYGTGEFEGESLGDLTTDSFSINTDGELILTY